MLVYKMVAISLTIGAVLAIILGLVILIWPGVLRWAIGLYLIVIGVLQLIGAYL